MANSKQKATAVAKKPAAKRPAAAKAKTPAKQAVARKPLKAAKAVPSKGKAAAPARRAPAVTKAPKSAKKIIAPKAKVPVKSEIEKVSAKSAQTVKKVGMALPAKKDKDTITREDGRYALPNTVVVALPANYRPLQREEYMNPRQLAYFRTKLQKWREDLVEESKQTIDNLREEVRDVGDEAERATRETENSLELRTRDRYRKLIAKIDKALKRIEEGRYGFCEETDEEIGLERLEARPIATLCLDAQERWEHRQKQMGD
jgi:DnaK suppressor protein